MRGFELSYNEEMNEIHIPVLLSSTIEYLAPKPGESYLDLTAGYGGHADKILEVTQDYNAAVLNDRDQNAIDYLNAKYQKKKPNLLHNDFYSTALQLVENNKKFDIILADFGVSSPQLDKEERGFSFSKPARLDANGPISGAGRLASNQQVARKRTHGYFCTLWRGKAG